MSAKVFSVVLIAIMALVAIVTNPLFVFAAECASTGSGCD